MALTLRNKRITKLFRLVFGEEKGGLMSRQSPLKRRMRYAVVLSRLLAGRNQIIRLRKLIRQIESAVNAEFEAGRMSATEVQSIAKLAAVAYEQLSEADQNRLARTRKLTKADEAKLLAETPPPFAEPSGCEWYSAIIKARVVWTLAVPFEPFNVVRQKELENVETIPADAAV